jgi:hypothetical protein
MTAAPTYHLGDVEPLLRERLPAFAARLDGERSGREADDDAEHVAYTALEDLRLWLLGQRWPWQRRQVGEAFGTVEDLCRDGDDDVQGALAVALLEGTWPRAHRAAMGPATRRVRDLAQRPSWGGDEPSP